MVVVAKLGDAIHPITAEYVVAALAEADRLRADLFVLEIDTPGGLDTAMREIIQAFLGASTPVCLYVAPSGARAASAGFFMAMAADIVAMAPGTNMGAASPVAIGGGDDETMHNKIVQDASAYIRSLALERGRPPDLAAEAVISGRSYSAAEAIELGLADLTADDLDDLMAQLDGRQLPGEDSDHVLVLTGAEVVHEELSLRQRILSTIANPQVAYVLMLIGLGGLYFELSTPGAILPGVLGGICLVLAVFAFQILPISYAGLALIGLAMLFFILEVKVTSYGLLTVAGLVSFVLGSLMLIPGPIPEMQLHPIFVIPAALSVAAVAAFLVSLVLRTHRGRVRTGRAGLVSEIGYATTDLGPETVGKVFVHGEIWRARSESALRPGAPIEVVGIETGMVIRVRPADAEKGS